MAAARGASSIPPTISSGKCTPRYTRDVPTSKAPANASQPHPAQRLSRISAKAKAAMMIM